MGGGKNAYQSVVEELKVLQTLSHPNIIWLNEIIDDPKKDDIYLVTEWLSKGSLHDLVEERNQGRTTRIGLPISVVRTYLSDMIKALDYCHNVAGVFHRDIKPENIMLNHNDEAILIDFGVSALKKGNDAVLKNKIGTLLYFAPEMFQSTGEDFKVRGDFIDLWALGVTFFYLITGQHPFNAGNFFDLKQKVLEEEINFGLIKHEASRVLLQKMLEKDPNKRAKLEDLINDPWVTSKGALNLMEVDYSREDEANFGNISRKVTQQFQSNRNLFAPDLF